jgi:hypothetical protein
MGKQYQASNINGLILDNCGVVAGWRAISALRSWEVGEQENGGLFLCIFCVMIRVRKLEGNRKLGW